MKARLPEAKNAALRALLTEYDIDWDVLTTKKQEPPSVAAAILASRILIELAESIHPGPREDFKRLVTG